MKWSFDFEKLRDICYESKDRDWKYVIDQDFVPGVDASIGIVVLDWMPEIKELWA